MAWMIRALDLALPYGHADSVGSDEIFREFVHANAEAVRSLPVRVSASVTDRCALIVEPRRHYALEFCVRVAASMLGPSWYIHVVCGEDNVDWAAERLLGVPYRLTVLRGVRNLSIDRYNDLCLSSSFWRHVDAKTVLVFQTDSLILKRDAMDAFVGYDYIGAPTGVFGVARPEGRGEGGMFMNGGLSLRSRDAMLECLERVSIRPRYGAWGSHDGKAEWEDRYYCRALRLLRSTMPPLEEQMRFSVEKLYYPDPVAFHKPWAYLSQDDVHRLLERFRATYLTAPATPATPSPRA